MLPENRFNTLPEYFTRYEMNQILSYPLKLQQPEIYFLVSFLWRTGARVSEALSATVADIDLGLGAISIRTLRRRDGHVRSIPLQPDFAAQVIKWIECRNLLAHDRLFAITRKTAYNWVLSACRRAGFDDGRAHPQSIRHSFAVNLLSQGLPITTLQDLLGHADLGKTLIYTRLIEKNSSNLLDTIHF